MQDVLSYEFMRNAIIASIMASIVCGAVGPFIVTRRMVFVSGGLSHAAFGGLGIAYWLGIKPLYGAVAFVLFNALIIAEMENDRTYRNDIIIGILWAIGVAVGVIFIYMTPGYAPDLMSFLFGNVLIVSHADLVNTSVLVLIVIISVFVFFRGFVLIAFDEDYARAKQLPVKALNRGLIVLVAVSIVTLIQVVGIILVIALMTIPVAIANEVSMNFKRIMLLSALLGIFVCIIGLFLSYFFELPSGASIVIVGGIILGLVKSIKKLFVTFQNVSV
jgi:zinc transport system permease protein